MAEVKTHCTVDWVGAVSCSSKGHRKGPGLASDTDPQTGSHSGPGICLRRSSYCTQPYTEGHRRGMARQHRTEATQAGEGYSLPGGQQLSGPVC